MSGIRNDQLGRTGQGNSHIEGLRVGWAANPHRYEIDWPGNPAVDPAVWGQYVDAFAPYGLIARKDAILNREYWNDPQPWDKKRLGGKLMSDAERVEEELMEELYGYPRDDSRR